MSYIWSIKIHTHMSKNSQFGIDGVKWHDGYTTHPTTKGADSPTLTHFPPPQQPILDCMTAKSRYTSLFVRREINISCIQAKSVTMLLCSRGCRKGHKV